MKIHHSSMMPPRRPGVPPISLNSTQRRQTLLRTRRLWRRRILATAPLLVAIAVSLLVA